MARPWSKKETESLLLGVGVFGIAWLCKRGGAPYDWPNAPQSRSPAGVYMKARRLYGRGGLARGAFSLAKVVEATGYSLSQIRRAMTACRQKWKRTSKTGRYIIYDEQVNEITDWLRSDYWSKVHRLYNCQWCGTDERRHLANGLCTRCYDMYAKRLKRAGLPYNREGILSELELLRENHGDLVELLEVNLRKGRAMPREGFITLVGVLNAC